MKPAPFTYHRATSTADAVLLLGELGGDARVIAGGQSLLPMMNFRLARPEHLIDVSGVPELAEWSYTLTGDLQLGATVTHRTVEVNGAALSLGHQVLARAMGWVGHLPIRTRGTVGGSLAHGDKTAEWVNLALAYNATVHLLSKSGPRDVPASDFFLGPYMTDMAPDELLTGVTFPATARRGGIAEYARRHGDFAMAAATVLAPAQNEPARVVVTGPVGMATVCAAAGERWADSGDPSHIAATAANEVELIPPSGMPTEYARSLVAAVVERAVTEAKEKHE